MDHYLISLTGSSGLWPLLPAWPVHEERRVRKSALRTDGGRLYTYVWGTHFAARVPLAWVEEASRRTLVQWWREQRPLALLLDDSGDCSTLAVRIVNPREPLPLRMAAAGTFYAGELELEGSADGDKIAGAPFILDHARFGTLDTFNLLL